MVFNHYFGNNVGAYRNRHLQKTDPRIKILVSVVILTMILSYKGFIFPLVVSSLCLFLCLWMRIPLRLFLLRLSEPLFIALIIIILKLFFSGKEVLFTIKILGMYVSGYKDGLLDGSLIAGRIFGAVSLVETMAFSTPFTGFIAGLSWLRVPKGFVEVLMFAYRYIFVLFEDAMVIYNAQKNRLGYSNIRQGLRSFGILAGSLMLKAFEHSHSITVSMIQRGYDGNIPILRHEPFKKREVVVSALIIAVMGVVWTI